MPTDPPSSAGGYTCLFLSVQVFWCRLWGRKSASGAPGQTSTRRCSMPDGLLSNRLRSQRCSHPDRASGAPGLTPIGRCSMPTGLLSSAGGYTCLLTFVQLLLVPSLGAKECFKCAWTDINKQMQRAC